MNVDDRRGPFSPTMEDVGRAEFSVCQFFPDGSYEYVRRYVRPLEAVRAFKHYTTNVAARCGFVTRVILTDGGDCVNMEWKQGEGVVYPEDMKGTDR